MGSPWSVSDITFKGDWIPPLPTSDWQNIKATSPDGRYLALVLWNTEGNTPGFHIVRIDTQRRRYHKTRRIRGFCTRVYWDGERFRWWKQMPA